MIIILTSKDRCENSMTTYKVHKRVPNTLSITDIGHYYFMIDNKNYLQIKKIRSKSNTFRLTLQPLNAFQTLKLDLESRFSNTTDV